jgi:hypothetical protein
MTTTAQESRALESLDRDLLLRRARVFLRVLLLSGLLVLGVALLVVSLVLLGRRLSQPLIVTLLLLELSPS